MSRASIVCASLLFASCLLAYGEAASIAAAEEPAKPTTVALPPGRVFPEPIGVEKRIYQALAEPTELQYLDTTLEDVAMDLSLRHKIPIMLDLQALTADGKGKETTVSLQVRETSLRNCLRLLLGGQGLAYVVRNEALLLTTKSAAEAMAATRVYQVHDLVLAPSGKDAPDYDGLMELIVTSVQPETWREAGGTAGTIRSFEGPGIIALAVTHTEEAHDQIGELLSTLRAAREPKVEELQRRSPPRPKLAGGFGGGEPDDSKKPDDSAKPAAKETKTESRSGGFF
ncbi:MAG: hypothetical protein J0M17_11875 [Planctomycetes bacterium]|nr:hypothetical protein [Planctomycetota bacterium]